MTFTWPWMLVLLLAVPILVLRYRQLARSRADRRARLASLGLVATTGAGASRTRRVLPPLLFLLALTLLVLGLARPQATVNEPRREGTVVLAFDVSNSMAATDVQPSRLEAAKAAARRLVAREPHAVRIAVVAFGENGVIAQQPTLDRVAVLAALRRLSPQGGTTLGYGIQTSLSAIVGKNVVVGPDSLSDIARGPDLGYFRSAAVVLFTDGENTGGPDPQEAAAMASTAGIKVYPVGLGTTRGAVVQVDGYQVATALHEPVLRRIASTTDGRYLSVSDSAGLNAVYSAIDLDWTVQPRAVEITGLLAAAAAVLLLVGAGLTFAWFGRVI